MNAIKMSVVSATIAAILLISLVAASNVVEVCQWESFEANCDVDEVIVMKQARYGRMRVGKCLPQNSRFVGCSADVTEYMHGRCSGRQNCEVPVPDPVMFASQPCPIDLVAHLEADYECVKVTKWDQKSCDNVLTATSGFIAKPSDTIEDIRMRHHCPHRIVAQPGQTINVYLSDFFNKYHYQPTFDVIGTAAPIPDCINYGHITEDNSAPSGICGGQLQKDVMVYRSKSNVVDITLTGPSSHAHHYLIKFEVVGCPRTLEAPESGWIEYQQDRAYIHCNHSNAVSELVCNVNQWEGHMPNTCVEDSPIDIAISAISSGPFSSTSVIVAVTAGITFGIMLGSLLLVFAACHYKKSSSQQELPIYQQSSKFDELKKSFNGGQDYHYAPIVDPNYVPVVTDEGLKTFKPSEHVHHIVNVSNCGNYAVIVPAKADPNAYAL